MALVTPQRSLRLIGRNSNSLDSTKGIAGEIFYDSTNNTLRIFTGQSQGGTQLVSSNLLNEYLFSPRVAFGYGSASPINSIAIGNMAGSYTNGENNIAIGNSAGSGFQGADAVAVGHFAGASNQGIAGVSIGSNSGAVLQGNYGIAIGYLAGNQHQGANSIAIGRQASPTNQYSNSIVINATGSELHAPGTDTLTISPIRESSGSYFLAYNTTSKEVTYTSSISASVVGLGNVTNESKATMFNNPTFTGTVSGITLTASSVGLGNVTNESKATMFTSPTFTGTVSGVTATHVGLGNVTNESKATMFTNPTLTFSSSMLVNYTGASPARTHFSVDNSNVTVGWVDLTIDGTNGGGNLQFSGGGKIYAIGTGSPSTAGLAFNGGTGTSTTMLSLSPTAGATFGQGVTLKQSSEVLNTKTAATGVVTHDLSTGAIFYHSSISANFTANFTNVSTTDNRTIVGTLILIQGSTAYIPNAVQIDGVSQTIKWLGNSIPTGNASKVDMVNFTLIRTGSAWTVLGSLSTYG